MINVGVIGFAHGHVMSYGQNWLDHPELGVKITAGWDHDAERCKNSCEKLGATPVGHGDAGYEFDFFGPYRVRILVWEGDDEFPPNAQVLYTDNFAAGFSAEDRVVAGDILISHIKAAM